MLARPIVTPSNPAIIITSNNNHAARVHLRILRCYRCSQMLWLCVCCGARSWSHCYLSPSITSSPSLSLLAADKMRAVAFCHHHGTNNDFPAWNPFLFCSLLQTPSQTLALFPSPAQPSPAQEPNTITRVPTQQSHQAAQSVVAAALIRTTLSTVSHYSCPAGSQPHAAATQSPSCRVRALVHPFPGPPTRCFFPETPRPLLLVALISAPLQCINLILYP